MKSKGTRIANALLKKNKAEACSTRKRLKSGNEDQQNRMKNPE